MSLSNYSDRRQRQEVRREYFNLHVVILFLNVVEGQTIRRTSFFCCFLKRQAFEKRSF